ncbi:MAG: hypothetical protein C0599_06560 [Salinivirgaceae bacterium]|nr:MAG: hypothetical protein C0599_06560 [Salinivirgaceae bacterium]
MLINCKLVSSLTKPTIMRPFLLSFKLVCFLFLFSFFSSVYAQTPPSNLSGQDLRTWLKQNYYDGKHQTLGYTTARKYLYNYIDNDNGVITCVYSGVQVNSPYGGTTTYPAPINCEHTVPQSLFNEANPMVSDIHHLYPTYENWNSTRSNHPFAEINDSQTEKWMYLTNSQTTIPSSNIDAYSEYANSEFEPREDHKGNVARAIFYFYTMYPTQAGDMSLVADINEIYQWHLDDPVDAEEIARNGRIENYQGDRNPYIDYPEAVAAAWGFEADPNPDPGTGNELFISEYVEGSSYNKALEIANFTGQSVSLSNYSIFKQANGAGSWSYELSLSGTLNDGEVYVIAYSSASSTVTNVADLVTTSSALTFNGNDPVALFKNGTLIDAVGTFNSTSYFGANVTLVRNSDVTSPNTTYTTSEWTSYSSDEFSYLGSHTIDGGVEEDTQAPTAPTSLTASNVTQTTLSLSWNASSDNVGVTGYYVYKNGTYVTTVTSASYNVSGLLASTSYNFYVKAKDEAGNTSSASNTAYVTTMDEVSNDCYVSDLTLNLTTDNYPSETSWEVKDGSGQTVASGSGYSNKNSNYSQVISLAEGDYKFIIYDSYGDGICCSYGNGSYTLTDGNNDVIVSGGDYGSSESTDFCISGSGGGTTPPDDDGSAPDNYCASYGSNSSYEWIDLVSLGSIYNSTGNDGGYADYTNKSTDLSPGSQYTVSYSCGFSGSSYTEYWHVYIDFNRDGDFEDSGERVAYQSSSSSGTLSSTFSVPSDASIGNTRMRVTMKYNGAATPCETGFSYGEVEDYNINITDGKSYLSSNDLNLENLEYNIYPNPAYDKLNIEADRQDDFNIEVYNMNGQKVMETTYVISGGQLDVGALQNGVYMLQIRTDQKVEILRFVKR